MYYLYRHIRLDKNEPFYIGISRIYKGRNDYQRAFLKAKRNKIWKSIISRTSYEVEILFESEDLSFIKEKERELIKLYGKIIEKSGPLSNISDGGECESYVITDEHRKKISIATREAMKDPEIRRKMSESHRIPIIEINQFGVEKYWNYIREAANYYNISNASIVDVCKGRRKTCNKSTWKYAS